MKDLSVFKRGQVWYINDNCKSIGSIQGKSRPYLVVSNDKCNASSPVIHMAPLTTQDNKPNLPTHIQIYDPYRKLNQVILCEQTMPKSIPDISPVAKYLYTLNEEKMKEVDKALSIQFGISGSELTLDEFEKLLDVLKDKKIAQIREDANKLTSNRAEAYVNALIESVDKISAPVTDSPNPQINNPAPPQTVHKHEKLTQIDKFNMKLQRFQELRDKPLVQEVSNTLISTPAPTAVAAPHKRNRWTTELKQEFLADASDPSMPTSDILSKYNMTISTYNTMVSRLKKELKTNESTKDSNRKYTKPIEINKSDAELFLNDYNSKPISYMMEKYGLSNKKSIVNYAAICCKILDT